MSTKIHPGSVVCSVGNVPFTQLHDDLLAIDERAGFCYSMNPSAARVWELISKPASVDSVCAALCAEFGVGEKQCRDDVLHFVGDLVAAGLVTVTS